METVDHSQGNSSWHSGNLCFLWTLCDFTFLLKLLCLLFCCYRPADIRPVTGSSDNEISFKVSAVGLKKCLAGADD